MDSSLDDIEFLSRSSSRVQVLEAVTDDPRSRHELRELTGVSRVTINRILDDLEERDWIVRENGRCESTPLGAYLAKEYSRLLENVEVANQLEDSLSWLPTDAFDFDLQHLQDAEVFHKTGWDDHNETIRRIADTVDRTARIRGTAVGFSHEAVDAIRTATTSGDLTFEVVLADAALEMVRSDAGLRTRFQDILASGNASVERYTGQGPLHMVMSFDERVMVCASPSGRGVRPGWIRTDDGTVRSWARAYYLSARDEAEPLGVDDLAADGQATN